MSDHDHHHHNHHGEMHPHQLEPPHEVFHDPKAGEVARAWITNGGLSLSLHAMASGMAQQVAAACAEMGTGNAADNFAAIRKVLNEDLNKVAAQLSPLANKS